MPEADAKDAAARRAAADELAALRRENARLRAEARDARLAGEHLIGRAHVLQSH